MSAGRLQIRELLAGPPGSVHFVGIGGAGMAGLAFLLSRRGWRVSGCDAAGRSPRMDWLRKAGLDVRAQHDAAHAANADWMVRTAAVPEEHPEIRAARARQLPVFTRGQTLAAWLDGFESLAVCGTHGKTTTAAMATHILRAAGLDPSHCIGGESATLDPAGAGRGALLVVEADESDGTLSEYAPDVMVLTNVEFDHADHFADLAAVRACFEAAARRARRGLVYNADDPGARALGRGLPRAVSFGIAPEAEWRAAAIEEHAEGLAFDLWRGAGRLGAVRLPAPGRHNVSNALAACAASSFFGAGFEAMRAALETFQAVSRRFERVASGGDVLVISDYAHHPTELAAVLRTLAAVPRKRWLAVFQPHRFSRTRALADGLAAVWQGVDEVIVAPVYAASEAPREGGTAWDLYAGIRRAGRVRALCAASLEAVWPYLRTALRPGDGLLVAGAGDVDRIARQARAALVGGGAAGLDPADAWAAELEARPWAATRLRRRAPLAGYTTLRVGGAADMLAEVGAESDLVRLIQWARARGVPVTILGAGSNVLASDLGVRGLVIRLEGDFRRMRIDGRALRATAGAGAPLAALVQQAAAAGGAGLEFLAGIPGTVGGALRMNAGAWGQAIGDRTDWVRCLRPDGTEAVIPGAELGFEYRGCPGLRGTVVVEASFRLEPAAPDAVRDRVRALLAQRAWLDGQPTAGSVFRNPPGQSAGRLLEEAGQKGRRVGGARVLEAHANVIAAGPGAAASDVRALMELMRSAVRAKFDIELREELVCLE